MINRYKQPIAPKPAVYTVLNPYFSNAFPVSQLSYLYVRIHAATCSGLIGVVLVKWRGRTWMVLVGSLLQTLIWCGPMTSPLTMRYWKEINARTKITTLFFGGSPRPSTGLMLVLIKLRVLDTTDPIDSC